MALELPYGIKSLNPVPLDAKYDNAGTPYVDEATVIAAIPQSVRYKGLTVNIAAVEYWWEDGITDGDLVVKQFGTTLEKASQEEAQTASDDNKYLTANKGYLGWLSWIANKTVSALNTTSKNIVGAINELLANKADIGLQVPKTWYVSPTGSNATGTGGMAKPYFTVQKALDVCADGDIIELAVGTYAGSIVTTKSVTINGGGNSALQNTASMPKIIGNVTANSANPVVINFKGIQVVINNAVTANIGGGVLSLHLSGCLFSPYGINVSSFLVDSSVITIEYNTNDLIVNSDLTISNSSIINKEATRIALDGALGTYGTPVEITNTRIENIDILTDQSAAISLVNSFVDGDVTADLGDITIKNSVVTGNTTTNGSVTTLNQVGTTLLSIDGGSSLDNLIETIDGGDSTL